MVSFLRLSLESIALLLAFEALLDPYLITVCNGEIDAERGTDANGEGERTDLVNNHSLRARCLKSNANDETSRFSRWTDATTSAL
jgi:hypothetical protein